VTQGNANGSGIVAKVNESGVVVERTDGNKRRLFLYQDAVLASFAGRTQTASTDRQLAMSELALDAADHLRFYNKTLSNEKGWTSAAAPYYAPSVGLMFWLPEASHVNKPEACFVVPMEMSIHHAVVSVDWAGRGVEGGRRKLEGPLAGSTRSGEISVGG